MFGANGQLHVNRVVRGLGMGLTKLLLQPPTDAIQAGSGNGQVVDSTACTRGLSNGVVKSQSRTAMATRQLCFAAWNLGVGLAATEETKKTWHRNLEKRVMRHLELDVQTCFCWLVERSRTATGGFTTVFAGGHTAAIQTGQPASSGQASQRRLPRQLSRLRVSGRGVAAACNHGSGGRSLH